MKEGTRASESRGTEFVRTEPMVCIDIHDYEDCLTDGKVYEVEMLYEGNGCYMHRFLDDNGEFLQTLLPRFLPVHRFYVDFKGLVEKGVFKPVSKDGFVYAYEMTEQM